MSNRKIRCVIRRDGNVLRVNFGQPPDPPAPRFPGAAGLREGSLERSQIESSPFAANAAA
jgi:hypothetical protein